jgi:hypothetical protein
MSPISAGIYSISRSNEQIATMEGGNAKPGTPVIVLGPSENPMEQDVRYSFLSFHSTVPLMPCVLLAKWDIRVLSNGNVTVNNMQSMTFMSYHGNAEVDKPVGGCTNEREWVLYPSADPSKFL